MIYKFYDTCSLLANANHLFDDPNERVVISSISLKELEDIKTSYHKDLSTKFAARQLMRALAAHQGEYDLHIFRFSMLDKILDKVEDFELTNDLKILASAIDYDYYIHPDETVFVTNDLTLQSIANIFFGEDSIVSVDDKQDNYTGFVEIVVTDQTLSEFYENIDDNQFDLLTNQYLILKNSNGDIVDRLCWNGKTHRRLNIKDITSRAFGNIKPMAGDVYQLFALDSLMNNQVSMLCGKPGSGKTYLALGYLFYLLEKHEIDRIVVFCNPVVAKSAARLGSIKG